MAIIVEKISDNKRYILIGTGYGEYESATPGIFLGNLAPNVNHGESKLVCVCDLEGSIGWIRSDDVKVVEIDGKPIGGFGIDIAGIEPDA
jgi:hypothetical protein